MLRFAFLHPDEIAGLIARLSDDLPEHSVFQGSPGFTPASVTIMPVVARSRVLERRTENLRALAEYREACTALTGQYRMGTLPREWEAVNMADTATS